MCPVLSPTLGPSAISSADGSRVGNMFFHPHVPPPPQRVSDPGGLWYVQLGEFVLQISQDESVEDRDEVYKQDPGIGSSVVQMPQDEVQSQVDSVAYRPFGSVGELHAVLVWIRDGFQNINGRYS